MPVSPPTHQICGTAHWSTQPCPKGTRPAATATSPKKASVKACETAPAADPKPNRPKKPPRKAKKAPAKPKKPKVRRKQGAEKAPAVAQAKAAVAEITSGVDPVQVERRKEQIRRAVAKHRAKQKTTDVPSA